MMENKQSSEERLLEYKKKILTSVIDLQRREIQANEEKGISIIKYAKYYATWQDDDDYKPKSPVFFTEVNIPKKITSRSRKVVLEIGTEFKLNKVLIEYIKKNFDIKFSDDLNSLLNNNFKLLDLEKVKEKLSGFLANENIPGFEIIDMNLFGYFDYSKQAMVQDFESTEFIELIEDHELGKAIASPQNNPLSKEFYDAYDDYPSFESIDEILPSKEYLILDADSSQQRPIMAASQDFDIVIQGPPGTGKSQTIANMISYCSSIDSPKSILFVSEKRAAIDAVLKRLQTKDLDFLIFDVFEGLNPSKRKSMYQDLKKLLDNGVSSHNTLKQTQLDIQLPEIRKQLNFISNQWMEKKYLVKFVSNSNEEKLSISQIFEYFYLFSNELSEESTKKILNSSASLSVSVDEITIEKFETLLSSITKIRKIINQDYESFTKLSQYFFQNKKFIELETLDELNLSINNVVNSFDANNKYKLDQLNELFSLPLDNLRDIEQVVENSRLINNVLDIFKPSIFNSKLEELKKEISKYSEIDNKNAQIELKKLKKELNLLIKENQINSLIKLFKRKQDIENALEDVIKAKKLLDRFQYEKDYNELITYQNKCKDIVDVFESLKKSREFLDEYTNFDIFKESLKINEIVLFLEEIVNLEIYQDSIILSQAITAILDTKLIEEQDINYFLESKEENLSAMIKAYLLHKFLRKELNKSSTLSGKEINRLVQQYIKFDGEGRVKNNIENIKSKYNDKISKLPNRHLKEVALIRSEINKVRNQAPLRELLDNASSALLELKPCWVMSPLVASQVLPRKKIFDLVIFDEASQVEVPSAMTAILRGNKLILAGDREQLPPTNFFKSSLDGTTIPTKDYDSILDVVDFLINNKENGNNKLLNHYRSKDERLITISNKWMEYNLNTLPTPKLIDSINFIKVDTELPSKGGTNPEEVEKVCEVIAENMKHHKNNSMIVIAFGSDHENAIYNAFFNSRFLDLEYVQQYLEHWDNTDEPFRIKNLETVQGDERDTVILSVGYGRDENNKVVYRFGPINQDKGDRRLNVAASRAKEKMTIISTLSYLDLEDTRLNNKGPKMLKSLLQYFELESNASPELRGIVGQNALQSVLKPKLALNPPEEAIKRDLEYLGWYVETQYGVSGYYIDFVVSSKETPGKWLAAIEFDGARYHASKTARDRDRLRQQHLENLGWKFYRIWSTDYFNDKQRVLKDLDEWLKKLLQQQTKQRLEEE